MAGRVYGGEHTTCPLCGMPVTMAASERRDLDGAVVAAVVVTDPGTFHAHVRDVHPDRWAHLVELRRKMNGNPFIGGSPRRVDGVLLRPGEDVGNLGSAVA
jgi:hypothetical protein